VGGAAWGTPAVNGSRVYVPRADDSLYVLLDFGLNFGVEAVAAVPGGVSDAPVVNAAGNVCFGTGDGWLFLMSATLDSTLWSIQLEAGSRVSAPAIGPDGTIYAGTGAGRVFAIRAADGDTLWTAVLHGSSARPVVGAGAVFVPTAGGWLHALDPGSGAELWQWQSDLGRALVAAPILTSGGYIYCQDTTDVVYCLRQSDRTRVWSCDCRSFLPQGGNHGSEWTRPSPAITSAGDVIVPGYDALFSLPGLRGEVLGASAWPKWQHDPYNSGKAGSRVR
jgi:outer membrane protein assembly factor BamB